MRMNIPTDLLAAALVGVSKEKTRYYLRGVFVDPRGYLVSTDGHRVLFAEIADKPMDGVIIPQAAAAQAVKAAGKGVTIDYLIEDGKHWLIAGSTRIFFEPIDGTFPPWDRIVPAGDAFAQETPARFNPKYYADLGKVAKILTTSETGFRISQSADGPCGITFGDRTDCAGVLTPLRAAEGEASRAWSGFAVF